MAYSDDAVKAKLSGLNETQDSIVTVAQWIMFHRRHADRTASLWLNRLQENTSTSKRLNLIYLANEVVQQSRARSKTDFLVAFEPLIADATSLAYKGASQDVQGKLRRVVEVWRSRQIFDPRIQDQVEQRLNELDKQKGGKSLGGSGGRLGGSLFGGSGSSIAPELEQVNKSQSALTKAEAAVMSPVNSANAEYAKMTDPSTPVPSAPVRAAKLRGLVKDLMAAQSAVNASMKTRRELIAGLEKLLESNSAKMAEEEITSTEIRTKIDSMEATIRHVEDSIMRGQDAPPTNDTPGGTTWTPPEPERPETEGFTPPPPDVESFTPPTQEASDEAQGEGLGVLSSEQGFIDATKAEPLEEQTSNVDEPAPSYIPSPVHPHQDPVAQAEDFLKSLVSQGQVRQASGDVPAGAVDTAGTSLNDPRLKRRKLGHNASNSIDDEFFSATNVGGVDEDGISALLSQ